jgi:tRNA threonylcarbamoyladenosine biosynthesis protein TsaE
VIAEEISVKQNELDSLAKKLLSSLSLHSESATVVTLRGDLGAGKTTFVQAMGKVLKVPNHITSPTFSIINQYPTNNKNWSQLVHMDAYRIDDLSELRPLAFESLLKTPNTLFCIEWPERIQAALPTHYTELQFENSLNEDIRKIHILTH